jgi:quinol monooxygenase YgiN
MSNLDHPTFLPNGALIRIVRMDFKPESLPEFLSLFQEKKTHIGAFPGCLHVELREDPESPTIRTTLSVWTGPEALEAYRHSDLFKDTWAKTKPLFQNPPQAFSLLRDTFQG